MQAIAARGTRFAPDRAGFARRIEASRREQAETAAVVKAHLIVFGSRVSAAMKAIEEGNLGSARSFLKIGERDYQAAIKAIPE
jgi:hypothetical protein